MKSFQTRILEELESIADRHGCDVVQSAEYGNCGTLLAQRRNPAFGSPVQTVARLSYLFQPGHNTIKFNGHPMGPDDMSALYKDHEDHKIATMLETWNRLVREGKHTFTGFDYDSPGDTPQQDHPDDCECNGCEDVRVVAYRQDMNTPDGETDKHFLEWLISRMTSVYGESVNVDFVRRLIAIANVTPVNRVTNW